jgi:hypothetical protein
MKKVLLTLIVTLAFCGSIFAQQYEPYWEDINIHGFSNHDPFVAVVALDNNFILHEDNFAAIEVAAFVGDDDYRGHGFLKSYQSYGDLYPVLEFEIFYNPVGNDEESSIPVHFKMYDHSTNTLYDYWTSTMDIVTQVRYNKYPSQANMDAGIVPIISFFHTFTKPISAYTEDGGYYLIASPLNQAVSPEDVLSMISNNYDLYAFDQSAEDGLEWRNYETGAFETLEAGKGYLYANSGDVTLTFIGAPYTGTGEVTLNYDANAEFPGWNLVGNPFAQTAIIDRDEFYVMKSDGTEIITSERNTVNPMEGIFVVAATDGETLTFSTTEPNQSKGQIVLNVTQDRGNVIDRAIVRFQGSMLPKFMLNENNTKLYIPENGDDFAVVRSKKSGRLPINFEPAQNGNYTISVYPDNVNMKYLHLVDNMTGSDIDLLRTPSYSFDASTTDNAERFVLVFKVAINPILQFAIKDGNTKDFGFYSDGNWIINNDGDAILQVVDLNGQILSSEEISGCVSKHIEAAPGIYMLRLINGNDMKVQKIIVK